MSVPRIRQVDAHYEERDDTLTLELGGHLFSLTSKEAFRLLDIIEMELYGPSLVADHKGD
jgi:hypothetical protein